MAAKQGLTAQLSQASEDAKRAVLSRTGVHWFSNLNTVCTIKSAPPKTPDVLQMLAVKSGWLFKRNEQHVWQSRWCCIVPHMFLYYFDALPTTATPLPPVTAQQQMEWNQAIQMDGFKQHEKRGFSLFPNNNNNSNVPTIDEETTATTPAAAANSSSSAAAASAAAAAKFASTTMQPAGIIDLECYTTVHRSDRHHVLELCGDDTVNPDLRAFYFCAPTSDDKDDWTDALLNGRHAALLDEVDAYKQVSEGFASQLQTLHCELDELQAANEILHEGSYQVRSMQEEQRRNVWKQAAQALERPPVVVSSSSSSSTAIIIQTVETLREQVPLSSHCQESMPQVVQILCDYLAQLEDNLTTCHEQYRSAQQQLQITGATDQQLVQSLQQEVESLKQNVQLQLHKQAQQQETWATQMQQSQKEVQDLQKELSATKLEMTMVASQQKNKLSLLNEHKRILKKEVIDMRSKLEDAYSELNALRHKHESSQMMVQQEKQKSHLLERYVEKMESQVKVQQNMMEMMSQSGAGSVFAGSVPPILASNSRHDSEEGDIVHPMRVTTTTTHNKVTTPHPLTTQQQQQPSRIDADEKSHMSELTEDRTQRQLEYYDSPSPRIGRRVMDSSPRPPSYILGNPPPPASSATSATPPPPMMMMMRTPPQHNVMSSSSSLPPVPRPRGDWLPPRSSDAASVNHMSVAQKARQDAERSTTPVRVRLDQQTLQRVNHQNNNNSTGGGGGGPWKRHNSSGLWKRMEEAVLGPRPDDMESDASASSIYSTRVTDYTEVTEDSRHRGGRRRRSHSLARSDVSDEKKTDVSVSVSQSIGKCGWVCYCVSYLIHFSPSPIVDHRTYRCKSECNFKEPNRSSF